MLEFELRLGDWVRAWDLRGCERVVLVWGGDVG